MIRAQVSYSLRSLLLTGAVTTASGCMLVGYDALSQDDASILGEAPPATQMGDGGNAHDGGDAGLVVEPDADLSPDATVPLDSGHSDAGPHDSGTEDADPDGGPAEFAPTCNPSEKPICHLWCLNLPYCAPQCQPLQVTCEAHCSGTAHCAPVCNAVTLIECLFDCQDTGRCSPHCKDWGHCTIDCRNSRRCDETLCDGSPEPGQATRCKVLCEGAESCAFAHCWGDEPDIGASGYGTLECDGPKGRELRCGYTSCTDTN